MVVSGRPNLMLSPGPGLWSLVLGPYGPDLGPDLDLTWDLDLSLTIPLISVSCFQKMMLYNPLLSTSFNG